MAFTESSRSVAPVASPAEIRDLAACGDGVAVHHPGGVRPKLAIDGGEGRVIDETEALRDLPALHQCNAVIDRADGLEVGIAHPDANVGRTLCQRNGLFDPPGVERLQGLAGVEIPVLRSLRLRLEKPLGPVEPSGRNRVRELHSELTGQRQGNRGGTSLLARLKVRAVCALECLDPLVWSRRPPCRLAHHLDILGSELLLEVRLLEHLEGANPLVPLEGIAGFCQTIADGLAHGRLNYGAEGGIRTHDRRFTKPLLYH